MSMRAELVPGQSGPNEPCVLIPILINLHLHQAFLGRTNKELLTFYARPF